MTFGTSVNAQRHCQPAKNLFEHLMAVGQSCYRLIFAVRQPYTVMARRLHGSLAIPVDYHLISIRNGYAHIALAIFRLC